MQQAIPGRLYAGGPARFPSKYPIQPVPAVPVSMPYAVGDKRQLEPEPVQLPLQNLETGLLDLIKYSTWRSDVERAHEFTPLVTQLYTDSIYRKQEAKGDELLKEIESCIDLFFPKGRFGFQEDLHNQMLRATLMQTLGDDYRMLVQQVCRERGWKGPNKNLFTIASRRSGKTTGIASMVGALLICVPNIQIVVYSVAKRSAEEFVRLVEKYIQMHPKGRGMIKNPGGAEMLVLNGTSPGDERRIRSFPSGGNAANVSILSFSLFFLFSPRVAGPNHTHMQTTFIIYFTAVPCLPEPFPELELGKLPISAPPSASAASLTHR